MKTKSVKPVLTVVQSDGRYHAAPQARSNRPDLKIVAEDATAELLIYDDIGDYFGFGVGATSVVEQLNALPESTDRLNVRINSPGGDVFDGGAIYNALARLRIPVDVYIDGLAASIASVIAMAGDTITMASNAMTMIHKPWMVSMGEAGQLRSDADVLDQVDSGLVRIYSARTGLADDVIADMMAAETWMTAEEAKAAGFADEITDPVGVEARRNLDRYKFQHVPAAWSNPDPPPAQPAELKARVAALADRRRAL